MRVLRFAKSLKLRWGHTDPRPLVGRETHSIAAEKRGVDWHSMQNAFRRPRFFSLLQRYDYSKVIDYSSYSKKEHPTLMLVKVKNSKFVKTLGEIGLDVLF